MAAMFAVAHTSNGMVLPLAMVLATVTAMFSMLAMCAAVTVKAVPMNAAFLLATTLPAPTAITYPMAPHRWTFVMYAMLTPQMTVYRTAMVLGEARPF